MSRLKGHSKTWKGVTYHYLFFDSVGDFDAFVRKEFSRLSSANKTQWQSVIRKANERIERGSDWYGTPIARSLSDLEQHSSFLGMPLLEKLRPKLKGKLEKYLNYLDKNVLPKPKMAYNDRSLGIFSFDRAAMGLFRHPRIQLGSPVNVLVSQLKVELEAGDIQTTSREVWCHFENRHTAYPSLRLYLVAGANAVVNGDELLYIGLACAELADFLEARGIALEINILMETSFDLQDFIGVVRVKAFENTLDINQLLLMSSDPRYYRYQGFKALVALSNYFGRDIPYGLGSSSTTIVTFYQEILEDQGLLFQHSYGLEAAAREVSRIIEEYAKKIPRNAA